MATPQERLKDLVEALNAFVAAGNEDISHEKIRKDFTHVMQQAHSLSFAAVDVSTRLGSEPAKEAEDFGTPKASGEPMGRFAKVIELHTARAKLLK